MYSSLAAEGEFFLLLALLRPLAQHREAVHMGAVKQRGLRGCNVGSVAVPQVQRRLLKRTTV